jgi:hypothetical protein
VADLAEGLRSIEGRRRYGDEMYTILDPWGKRQVLNAGHGSVRIATARKDTNHFAYMALVDEEHWHCDYGVPVVVSRPVFREYQRYSENSSPAVKWLEGIVRIGAELPLSQLIPRAIGGKLSKASEDSLRSRPNLPRCYVHVVSPLSTKLLYNRSHPEITAWTMYATSGAKTHGNIDPYGYSYVILNPRISGAYEEAGAFLQHYAKGHGGVRLITDYDGVVPRLEAEIPLSRNAIAGHRPAVRKLMKGIDKWAARTLDRSNR